jgi:pimeloyl-ACP methyl ester carboxylesterase
MAGPRSLLLDLLGHGISDRPQDFDYSLESHADAVAAALTAAGVADAEVIGHSLGGAVAIALAHRHPELVSRLVLADAVLDPIQPCRPGPGSSGIASYSEQEFLDGGWREVREAVGPHWWSTMRLADRTALHRSAVHRTRGTLPKPLRALLLELPLPRTFLHPAAETVIGADQLTAAGVNLVPIPDAGHNLMLDAPDAFAAAVAASLS